MPFSQKKKKQKKKTATTTTTVTQHDWKFDTLKHAVLCGNEAATSLTAKR